MIFRALAIFAVLILSQSAAAQTYLGNLSTNPSDLDSVSNPYGAGSRNGLNSINNIYGKYGSPSSNRSVRNPYATKAPKLYDQNGNYRGRLSSNRRDPDSISNPYGRYGNPSSPDSIHNPLGAGNPSRIDSPTNPYGRGWKIIADDD